MIYKRDYYVSIGDEQVIITKNAIMPYNVMEPRNKYFYKVGDKVLTPFGIQTIKDIIKDYSSQPGHEWIILVEENGNQYKPCGRKSVLSTTEVEDRLRYYLYGRI